MSIYTPDGMSQQDHDHINGDYPPVDYEWDDALQKAADGICFYEHVLPQSQFNNINHLFAAYPNPMDLGIALKAMYYNAIEARARDIINQV